MSIEQKNIIEKSTASFLVLIFFLSSCITTSHIHYSDPNYLSSNEFSTYKEINTVNNVEMGNTNNDSSTYNYEYMQDEYYDYGFSSRIRRFHRPMYYSGYYGGIYTDYYWYNNDPFYYGTSIYYGYNWYPSYYSHYGHHWYPSYYSYYGYSAYPYYSSMYHPHVHYSNNNYYDAYISNNRGFTSNNPRGIKKTTNRKKLSNNVRANNNKIKSHNSNDVFKTNRSNKINTNNRQNITKNTNQLNTKSNRATRSYSKNRSYNSNSGRNKSNNINRFSGNRRNIKPRR